MRIFTVRPYRPGDMNPYHRRGLYTPRTFLGVAYGLGQRYHVSTEEVADEDSAIKPPFPAMIGVPNLGFGLAVYYEEQGGGGYGTWSALPGDSEGGGDGDGGGVIIPPLPAPETTGFYGEYYTPTGTDVPLAFRSGAASAWLFDLTMDNIADGEWATVTYLATFWNQWPLDTGTVSIKARSNGMIKMDVGSTLLIVYRLWSTSTQPYYLEDPSVEYTGMIFGCHSFATEQERDDFWNGLLVGIWTAGAWKWAFGNVPYRKKAADIELGDAIWYWDSGSQTWQQYTVSGTPQSVSSLWTDGDYVYVVIDDSGGTPQIWRFEV